MLPMIFPEFVNEDGSPASADGTPAPIPVTTKPTPKPQPTQPRPEPATGCQTSQTIVQGKGNVCKGALIFNEEFDDGSSKDLSNWDKEIKFPDEPVSISSLVIFD